ncbi:hypothetical protein QFZ82_005052 [Streptomyces sp. V4I23]|uniref:pentapeptide repeat-containing protein n=1 Tax=Streptomyces sp. V4I23 TaxID=3042282 RepID=UPI002785D274|nr:pentapeptide repeat-containing protein [Streptomyces sp. V4I23]MDQ1010567.1 hypothetical protein [Streptomyces sp. V4I23]
MAPVPSPPSWPRCGHGADAADPVGCIGRSVDPHTPCLAHLADSDRAAYFATLSAGSDVYHQGTTFDEALLRRLLDAVRDQSSGDPSFGYARFGSATFNGIARFDSATFTGGAWFDSATFTGIARFDSATFNGDAGFRSARFTGDAGFEEATFNGYAGWELATFNGFAGFDSATFNGYGGWELATFNGDAWFGSATFNASALFESATFNGNAGFDSAMFKGDVEFESARFTEAASLGPLVCAGHVDMSGAMFDSPVTIAVAARRLVCRRTRWSSTAALQLRYATVDFSHAVFEYPLSISAETEPFVLPSGTTVDESVLDGGAGPAVRIASLRGVDAAHLVLANIDLSRCLLTGTVHLDQIRLEGSCTFAEVPSRPWRPWRPMTFTPRRTLAEEQHWRAGHRSPTRGWDVSVCGAPDARPASLAPVYRQLRKSFEDSKNEPGAADFYYGEMEMRRHDPQTPSAERGLLHAYWALSGYGLRALRAMSWLLLSTAITLVVMMLWGLPKDDPKPESTGTVTGQDVRLITDTPKPVNPDSAYVDRLSSDRFEKSLRVVVNSVIFRSSGQNLTTTGTYTEMVSRLAEPVLLGLAVLAVRGRVKR